MTEQFAIDTAQNAFMIALQIGGPLLVASTASTRVAINKNASTAPIGSVSVYGTSAGEHRQGVERTDHVAHERGGHPRPE